MGRMSEHGNIWWSELMTRKPDEAREFYVKLLGWSTNVHSLEDMSRPAKPGEPSYTVFMKGDRPVCGLMQMPPNMDAHVPAHWFTHIAVADVDKAVEEVKRLGGKVTKAPMDIKGVGRVAIITDPEGAVLGIGTPAAAASQASASRTKSSGSSKDAAA